MRIAALFATAVVGLATLTAVPAVAGAVFTHSAYKSTLSLQGGFDTPMTVAFDGKNYLGSSGGGPESPQSLYDSTGALLDSASPNPGIDFRSLFSDASYQDPESLTPGCSKERQSDSTWRTVEVRDAHSASD